MTVTEIVDLTNDVVPFLKLKQAPSSTLQDTINAAQVVIEDIVGHVINVTVGPEYHDGGDTTIFLRETPVLAVDTIVETIGLIPYTLTLQPVGRPVDNFGYTLDDVASGKITRRSAGSQAFAFYENISNISVTYLVGTATVAPNVKEACLRLVRHMYTFGQQSFGPASAYVPKVDETADLQLVETPSGFLVPGEVWELCQPNPRPIVFA